MAAAMSQWKNLAGVPHARRVFLIIARIVTAKPADFRHDRAFELR
jgi:hypothetical protein